MYHYPHDVSLVTRAMYDVTFCGLRVWTRLRDVLENTLYPDIEIRFLS